MFAQRADLGLSCDVNRTVVATDSYCLWASHGAYCGWTHEQDPSLRLCSGKVFESLNTAAEIHSTKIEYYHKRDMAQNR